MRAQPGFGHRIGLLDSFRYLAILMVASYHYYFRFFRIYPYGDQYRRFVFFEYGYMGVELFFMISGFVILMTLERSTNLKQFFARRFIRLFPAMVICSILTFLTFKLLDQQNRLPSLHTSLTSFIPSWTFTEPYFWVLLLHRPMNYVDGAYWSLAVEVKFYIAAGVLYFLSKKHFFRNWIVVVLAAITVRVLMQQGILTGSVQRALELILFPKYIILFTIGMFFFKLHNKEKINVATVATVVLLALCQIFIVRLVNNTWIEKLYLCAFIGMFVVFQYRSRWLSFLQIPILQRCGQASYALYLLHEYIGLFLIVVLSSFSVSFLIPVLVFILLTGVAWLIYFRVELPIAKRLKSLLLKLAP